MELQKKKKGCMKAIGEHYFPQNNCKFNFSPQMLLIQLISHAAGIRSWDVDLKSCNVNLYLQEFLSHHTVSFKGAGKAELKTTSWSPW